MNPDFPAVPEEQRGTLEKLQGMETVNILDEAYNVVPTGASCLKGSEQKSAALKKRGHIVEEVAARAVSKQAQFYEEGKRVKKEIVEHTEVRDQTPNMPVAFINTTSRGAGQLPRKVSPAAPRPNERQGPNLAQLPYALFGDEEDVQCLPRYYATMKDSPSIAKLFETAYEVPQESFKEIQANKAMTESFGLTNLEDFYSRIMAKIQPRLPVYHCNFLDVQFKVNRVLELLDPSDMPRFVKNFIYQSLKFQPPSNDDQGDIAYRNKDFHQQFKEGNPDLEQLNEDSHHKSQSNIHLGNQGANPSKEEQNKLKRKNNPLRCKVTDMLLDKSTLESETVDLRQEETKSKKRRKKTYFENNCPNQDVKYDMKGKRPVRGNGRIKRSSRKESVPQNTHESTTKSHEMHAPAGVIGPPPQNFPDLALITDLGVNDEEETTDHKKILLDLKKKVLFNRAKTAVANEKSDKQLYVRTRYHETHAKDRRQPRENIPNFTELFKRSPEEQKTGHERIVLTLVKNEEEWEIKKDPPDSNDYLSDGDEDMPEIQTSFEEDIMGIRTETNVPSYHYMANGVEEDDEQTLQYGFDGPFGRIIEN